ncbi:MAG: YhfC family intramembrane metalloprotease [Anaerolineales bacterium]|nr:YhfC family intramembrane metalloprotease [Anaerolineales bacterium]
MLEILLAINSLGMLLLPLIAAFYFSRKLKLSWKLFLAGALTFIASQVLHIPLVLALNTSLQSLNIVISAIVLGLLAGLFEETARYILYKFILKKTRTWDEGVYVGIGHGGVEAILLGAITLLTFVNMLAYRNMDLSTVPSIPAEQVELATQQVKEYWSTPAHMAILGLVERIFAMTLHVALSVMVLYGLVTKNQVWFWLAVLWHTIVDALAVYLVQKIDMLALEGIVGICAVISLFIIFWIKPKFAEALNVQEQSRLEETGAGTS